jgi:hypothetical protein
MRMAAKVAHDQGAVWESVVESQDGLCLALEESVQDAHSPTSYQLSVEHPDLAKTRKEYQEKLGRIAANASDAVGYAFYINGERNSIDTYASANLFRKLWGKLLDVAILEAISARNGDAAVPGKAEVDVWVDQASQAKPRERKNAPPRTRVESKSYENGVVFETFDHALGDHVALHTNIISK